jgi:hypothetical protein
VKLRHFSADIVTQVHGRRQERLFDQTKPDAGRKRRAGFGKPSGFWVSDETRGVHGWRAWCTSERFRSYAMRYEHEVVLSPNARILYLRTAKDIDAFADKYGHSLMTLLGKRDEDREIEIWGGKHIDIIDWHRVAKKYHGIIITPYIWSQRLGRHMWYYGWDCASGVIWNARAIESVTMIKERKAPHKPTRWELKRKHKRDMIRMAQASKDLVAMAAKTRPPGPVDEALVKSADDVLVRYGGGDGKTD